jgi:ribosomal protein S18 acetylase RimI-like enzyme
MTRRTPIMSTAVRPAVAEDRTAVSTLLRHAIPRSSHADTPAYFLRRAFDVGDAEARVLISERDDAVVGFVLFGEVAGTIGTGRLHYVAVTAGTQRCGIGTTLCEAAIAELFSRGARSVVAEMPDDADEPAGRALIERCGLTLVARVADYYRDTVDLLIFERRSSS